MFIVTEYAALTRPLSFVQAVNSLVRLCRCTDSSEHSLVFYGIYTEITYTIGPYKDFFSVKL